MPKLNIDLQCHTTASDGLFTPEELVNLALKKRLKVIAITDHDSVNGIESALKAAKGKDINIIKGVEISCDDHGFVDTHILGLFIDHKNKTLTSLLKRAKGYREQQKKDIINKLRKLGFKISYKEVRVLAKEEIGRPHIAKVVLKNNPDKVTSIDDVFERFLSVGKKAYVERRSKISVNDAIKAIHAAHGLVFIAHPGVYDYFDIDKFIKFFIKNRGDGIETYYDYSTSRHHTSFRQNNEINEKFRKIAKKYSFLETGGSDFHGRKDQVLGRLKVPYSVLENLRKKVK